VVLPQTRDRGGWRCEIVAAPPQARTATGRRVWLSDEQVEALPGALLVGEDAELFALLWQVRVRQRFHAGPVPAVGRVLAEQLRPTGARTVVLDPVRLRRLCIAANLRPPGARHGLARLAQAGMLTLQPSTVDDSMVVGLVLTVRWAGLVAQRAPFVAAGGR
jgi:hypothetical protein